MNYMKRKTIAAILAIGLLFPTVAQAKTVEFTLNDTQMTVLHDEMVSESSTLPAFPFIANDRTMIPVRAVSENFGAAVSWDNDTRTVSIQAEGKDIRLTIDSPTAYVNDEAVTLDVAPTISGDITFVPVRFVTESLGFYVYFASSTGSVLVSDQPPVAHLNGVPVSYEELLGLYLIYQSSGISDADYAYMIAGQNTIVADLANKAGISLTDDQRNEIKSICESDPYPMVLRGQLSMILEKDYLKSAYIEHVKQEKSAEITAYYEDNYFCAKHILVTGTDEEAKKKADDIYKEAVAPGADFDALIAQFGEDPGMATNPNGYVFTYGAMVAPFEEGTKALEIGEISEPVLTNYGYHIILRMPLREITEDMQNEIAWNTQIAPLISSVVVE